VGCWIESPERKLGDAPLRGKPGFKPAAPRGAAPPARPLALVYPPPVTPADDPALTTDLCGIRLRNPVILAAGTAGYLDEMSDALDLSRVGAIVTKSITRDPREGNPTWRILETHSGMLNAIGLANVGLDAFIEKIAPAIASAPTTVFGSVAGFSVEDYETVVSEMGRVRGIAAIELNVSCPNVHGGCEFGSDPGALRELIGAARLKLPGKPLFVKLSPIPVATQGHTMVDIAAAAIEAGASALCIANTIPAMAIDPRTRRPRLANTTGGLSGPAVHPVAVKLVYDVYRAIAREAGIPLIGIGGVLTWEDAAEFILAGATAIEMGTALFADPRSPERVASGLAQWTRDQRRKNIRELIGALEPA
jgi:dihydroorotate dehydrogenase (NAD+) catalytic subunit